MDILNTYSGAVAVALVLVLVAVYLVGKRIKGATVRGKNSEPRRPDFGLLAKDAHECGYHALGMQYELLDTVWPSGEDQDPLDPFGRVKTHYHGYIGCGCSRPPRRPGTSEPEEKPAEPSPSRPRPSHCEECEPARERMLAHLRPATREEYQTALRNWAASGGRMRVNAYSFAECATYWTATESFKVEALYGSHSLRNILVPRNTHVGVKPGKGGLNDRCPGHLDVIFIDAPSMSYGFHGVSLAVMEMYKDTPVLDLHNA